MTVTVRTAGPDDAAALADVAGATFALACPPGTSPAAIDAFVRENLSAPRFADYLADPVRTLLVAVEDAGSGGATLAGSGTTLAGYAMLVAGEPSDADVAAAVRSRPTVELSKCYVRADRHGGTVAAPLMAAALDAARADGASSVWLGVNQRNERAQRFYAKSGFQRVGTKTFRVGDELHDDFVLERVL